MISETLVYSSFRKIKGRKYKNRGKHQDSLPFLHSNRSTGRKSWSIPQHQLPLFPTATCKWSIMAGCSLSMIPEARFQTFPQDGHKFPFSLNKDLHVRLFMLENYLHKWKASAVYNQHGFTGWSLPACISCIGGYWSNKKTVYLAN